MPAKRPASPTIESGSAAPARRVRLRRTDPPTRFRVVFAGPVGAGKTTAVRALSDVAVVDTDVEISAGSTDRGDGDKKTTTVGLDYGVWKPTEEISVSLVGTPGQERFAEARNSVAMPNTRVVLWLRADRGTMADDAMEWIERFESGVHRIGIAVTRGGDDVDAARVELAEVLERFGIPDKRVQIADPRERESVMGVVAMALDLPEEAS